jgi:rhodanese-related sulfurtransferase
MTESKPQSPLFDRQQLRDLAASGQPVIVIDVRSAEEFAAGTVQGAIHVPADQLTEKVAELPKDATIVTVCNFGGARSCGAAEQLRSIGFEKAAALKGGVRGSSST